MYNAVGLFSQCPSEDLGLTHKSCLFAQRQTGRVEVLLGLLFEDTSQDSSLLLLGFMPSDKSLTSFTLSFLTCKLVKTRLPLPLIEVLGRLSKGISL